MAGPRTSSGRRPARTRDRDARPRPVRDPANHDRQPLGIDRGFLDAEAAAEQRLSMYEDLVECRNCGCTDVHACIDDRTGEPCHWVEPDLCSPCAS